MAIRDEVIELIGWHTGLSDARLNTDDIFGGNSCAGDDGDELIIAFSEKFHVNIDDFRDYFHYIGDEPPSHRRILPVGEDGRVIPFIPISVDLLVQFAQSGNWDLAYPVHEVRQSLRSRITRAALIMLLPLVGAAYIWAQFFA